MSNERERTLFHATAQHFDVRVGTEITLHPGKQNAQGVGVYFSQGEPDVRASDSVWENGLAWVFQVTFKGESSLGKNWWRSKGCRDRAKNRPKTFHSQGRNVRLVVEKVIGNSVLCAGELV